ncbi:hypothetical protein CDL15_Pgr029143 [Punica granatum]|uniref:Protein PLASTID TRANSCRIPTIONALLY ACTIVE 14 n=1 Tax=Punica granatum TaxID=22663 RepID=A0A218XLQ8_PUNGR|nr:hypothetical protein CDL15_Pgr029143 [Punica granatum]
MALSVPLPHRNHSVSTVSQVLSLSIPRHAVTGSFHVDIASSFCPSDSNCVPHANSGKRCPWDDGDAAATSKVTVGPTSRPLEPLRLRHPLSRSFNLSRLKNRHPRSVLHPQLEPADPDFYKIGFVRSMRAYGIEFKEGPEGFGVYASKDVEPLRRARVIMEIPLELMLTVSKKLPWMFFPDIIPIGHPIFDIINSTDPEKDWDLRLACLLLYAFDKQDNFWQLYGDFLPSADECTSLLLATEEDLLELQDEALASTMRQQQKRALEFWEKNWHNGVPLKIKRLARDPERFIWAVSVAQSRCIDMQMRIGALVQDANMLIPYAGHLSSLGGGDTFVDGAILAAARTLPTWSDRDVPPIPSLERKAAKELQEEGQKMLLAFPTTSQQDQKILDSMPEARRTLVSAIKYRLHRKLYIEKVIQAQDMYQELILY